MSTYRTLTEIETKQLHQFAIQTGRKWREVLCISYWNKGIPVPGFDRLYGLRNSHGAKWLNELKLPQHVRTEIENTEEFNKLSRPMQNCLKAAPFEIATWGGKPLNAVPGYGASMKTVNALIARGFLKAVNSGNSRTRYERVK